MLWGLLVRTIRVARSSLRWLQRLFRWSLRVARDAYQLLWEDFRQRDVAPRPPTLDGDTDDDPRSLELREMNKMFELPIAMKGYQRATTRRVIVIGCGGTGGFLVPNLARLIANLEDVCAELLILDGDKVERKNLSRQNFIAPDLGRYKAEVLAERYSAAFGLPILFRTEYLKDVDMLEELTPNEQFGANIVIGCVDNHRTRQVLAQWFRKRKGRIWIDAGNEEMNGQVVCGFHMGPYNPERKHDTFGLPCVADLFPEIQEDTKAMFNDELSCADRALEEPQNIATNLMAANYLLAFTQQVLLGEPLYTHGIFFSADRSTCDSLLNVASRLDWKTWPGYTPPRRSKHRKASRKARRKQAVREALAARAAAEAEAASAEAAEAEVEAASAEAAEAEVEAASAEATAVEAAAVEAEATASEAAAVEAEATARNASVAEAASAEIGTMAAEVLHAETLSAATETEVTGVSALLNEAIEATVETHASEATLCESEDAQAGTAEATAVDAQRADVDASASNDAQTGSAEATASTEA